MAGPQQENLFALPHVWAGGLYELALEYQVSSDSILTQALQAVWSADRLRGCWRQTTGGSRGLPDLAPSAVNLSIPDFPHRLQGTIDLPGHVRVPCVTNLVRFDSDSSWLHFGIPMGGLGLRYPVGAFPFDDGLPLTWRAELDACLVRLAEETARSAPFDLGLVGWTDGSDVCAADVAKLGVSSDRWCGLLLPTSRGMAWYPPTHAAPIGAS